MGRPRLYSDDERREKRRIKSQKWRAANLERAREITRECEKRRAAARAIAEGREPGKIGRPKLFTLRQRQTKRTKKSIRYYHAHKDEIRPKAAKREREKRLAKKLGIYVPVVRTLTEEQRKLRDRVFSANRRARLANNGGKHTAADIAELWRRQRGHCAFCLLPLDKSSTHVDHYEPIALGGTNDIGNLRLLHDTCNLVKGAQHPIDHALSNGMLCW